MALRNDLRITVKFDDNGDLTKQGGMVADWLQRKGEIFALLAKSSVGVDTGALQRSIDSGRVTRPTPDTLELVIEADPADSSVPYAVYHHEGTKAHVIRPKNGEWLYFRVNGRLVRARQVFHPGTRPNPYLTRWLPILFND